MKIAEADILVAPGLNGSEPEHWQSRWQAKLSTAKRVEQADWDNPEKELWVDTLVQAVEAASRPVVLIAHSLGVATVVHAAPRIRPWVKGAFLVACPDCDDSSRVPASVHAFGPLPSEPLGFHARVVASRTDPYCSYERAQQLAEHWDVTFQDAGESGHINVASGQGPWPEGLLSFAHFMKTL
ncbi:RBBP9/YdeN family alpha/beta hydrolase [Polycladidibacter hongkongensis]|uniref:RBBP9/YdeN family alpha/beta hydrolase n=1 Tax=Polycladidibacter hongkongensis TaxID=1647556 RepID=UPI00082BEB29|nr:alpha/beta hydrolase [Pseudovibrio hongkongensis]